MSEILIPDDVRILGALRVPNGDIPTVPRSKLVQDTLQYFPIPWTAWRVWDAYQTVLPGTSASDDLALIGGTFATGSPSIQTYDVKNAGAVTLYARTMLWLPPEYDNGETVNLRFHAGMLTTVASSSATIDAQCYKSDTAAGIGSDLVTTAAQSINSLVLADKDFVVDASGLSRGDVLDLRVTIAVSDTGTGTVVKAIIGAAALLLDIKG